MPFDGVIFCHLQFTFIHSDSVTPSDNVHYRDGSYVCVSQQITEIFLFELRVDATLSSSVTKS